MEIINTYICTDGRVRAYVIDDNNNARTLSYPRLIIEQVLGRPLEDDEEVHHKDGNPQNNNLDNLEVIHKTDHLHLHNPEKYHDQLINCQICGKLFIWTAKQQSNYIRDFNRKNQRLRGICCSKRCSALLGFKKSIKEVPFVFMY